MIIRNKLDRSFGPFAGSTGFFLFLGGLAATWFSLYGLILAAIGAFAAFTTTAANIDTDKKKIRFSNNLFGIFNVGKWIDIKPDMKLGLKRVHRGYQAYIRGTQPIGIHSIDIRIILYKADNEEIMQVNKFSSRESAVTGINELASILNLTRNDIVMA